MQILAYIAFLVVSQIGLMFVFNFSTYHRYFWPALPFLAAYAALVGWLLFIWELHPFFIWHVVLVSIWLTVLGKKQARSASLMIQHMSEDPAAQEMLTQSAANTVKYYRASSVVYVLGFSSAYLWLYNT